MPIEADALENANYIYPDNIKPMGRLSSLNSLEREVMLKSDRELYYYAEHHEQL
ncbi:protein of unknown function [Pararobbsia alpina]|uniref:hypothetical protein n=1 Tax=Pararobbsia alpina TaxID=621374 RepID=UPI0039A4CFE3